ncbi:CTD kinase subunit gamma CTK3-domain-containing protein [Calycina marina]|uniref:CTD kinase subunit gamma CTK3-domain-containing protein n=1 Tax=Calycina marina TaxID=1763456 RepID=A0A9P7Z273_9HELO|nr:CTD kinase subunit gamma CTK3-domain-containing protein [Calycina marina]
MAYRPAPEEAWQGSLSKSSAVSNDYQCWKCDTPWEIPDSILRAAEAEKYKEALNLDRDYNPVKRKVPRFGYSPSSINARKKKRKQGEMDPFEVRLRFTGLLQGLNASITSANKTAAYALKFRDMDEDLHSCIIEQAHLERNTMNVRANIMYFVEHLCDLAQKEGHESYVRMMQRDIHQIIDGVAPEDGSGAANVRVVRKVLQGLQTKKFLLDFTVDEIEEQLKKRDVHPDNASPADGDTEMADAGRARLFGGRGVAKLDKKQIEQRIEEDRERHKRLRENIWAIPPGGEEAEFQKLWDETSELGDDDYLMFEEEAAEKVEAAREW